MGIDQGFMGPNYSISTACATANYAFVNAANHIRAGDADVMLAGGQLGRWVDQAGFRVLGQGDGWLAGWLAGWLGGSMGGWCMIGGSGLVAAWH